MFCYWSWHCICFVTLGKLTWTLYVSTIYYNNEWNLEEIVIYKTIYTMITISINPVFRKMLRRKGSLINCHSCFLQKKKWDVVSVNNLPILTNLFLTCYPFNYFSTVLMFIYKNVISKNNNVTDRLQPGPMLLLYLIFYIAFTVWVKWVWKG